MRKASADFSIREHGSKGNYKKVAFANTTNIIDHLGHDRRDYD